MTTNTTSNTRRQWCRCDDIPVVSAHTIRSRIVWCRHCHMETDHQVSRIVEGITVYRELYCRRCERWEDS